MLSKTIGRHIKKFLYNNRQLRTIKHLNKIANKYNLEARKHHNKQKVLYIFPVLIFFLCICTWLRCTHAGLMFVQSTVQLAN